MNAVLETNFELPKQISKYKGKVREVFNIDNKELVMIVTDRLSAFDVVLPEGIPYKGQVLNQIADKFLDATADIVPNWKTGTPDENVMVGKYADSFPVEMIVRGYLTGSSWRSYKNGAREICGVAIPEGMKEHQKFDTAILTPTTKADQGFHDEDISREEILKQGLVSENDYKMLEKYSLELFERGSQIADEKGLILVDTKYEFGKFNNEIVLIDEIHTPDSSRYFYKKGYQERFDKGENQHQLSKEFVREWLMENNFQGKDGQKIPEMTPAKVKEISERYIELYEVITGDKFIKANTENVTNRIEKNILDYLNK